MGGDDSFARRGWSGPHRLMPAADARALGTLAAACLPQVSDPSSWFGGTPDFKVRPWYKSLHAHVSAFHDLACHPALVAAVTGVLGADVIAWGVSAMRKGPGDKHPWHVDIEHAAWRGVSVVLGLAGTVPGQSGLKFIGGSHRLRGFECDPALDDAEALALARTGDPQCSLDYPALEDGEFLLFDGPVWHASHNTGDGTRIAAILQYAAPSARVRIPLDFRSPVTWQAEGPPCVLVAGTDRFGVNRLVGRPQSRRG